MNPVLNNKGMWYSDLYTCIWIIITNIKELNKLRNYLSYELQKYQKVLYTSIKQLGETKENW